MKLIAGPVGHCENFKQEPVDSRPWHGGCAPVEHDRRQMGEAGEGCEGACFHAGGQCLFKIVLNKD